MIPDRELAKFSKAVAELYEPGLNGSNYVERAFRFISRLVPTDLSGHGTLETANRHLSASFDKNPPGLQTCFEAFGRLMHKYPPFRFDPSVNGGQPYSIWDFFSKREFRNTDVYHEVHRPLGFTDHCFVHVPTESGLRLFFGLFREGTDFSRRDKEIFALAQPHLSNARRLALAQTDALDILITPDLFDRAGFTPRECEVIFWLSQGKANIEIAHLMRVRTDTVSGYLRTIYEKMGVENRVAAAICALSIAKKAYMEAERVRETEISFKVPTA